jgi:uncharacterized membrane-anchored protein
MVNFLKRLLGVIAFVLVALISLGMGLIFMFSTLIAMAILFLAAKLRGQRFSVQEYWTTRQSRRKPLFAKGNISRDNVTDVQARDIH